jgi:GNAT superfamily N-acetyltransferase
MDVVAAGPADVAACVETITLAFRHDPVWSVALRTGNESDAHVRPFWRLYVEGGLRHGTVFITADAATTSIWIPPGEVELSAEQETAMRNLVEAALEPARASALFELLDRFDDRHPHDEPHAYLSMLATRPDLAGHGYGQRHLAIDLARWDTIGAPTYLESSNPGNDHRYLRQGYRKVGQLETVLDGAIVSTMWRPVGG